MGFETKIVKNSREAQDRGNFWESSEDVDRLTNQRQGPSAGMMLARTLKERRSTKTPTERGGGIRGCVPLGGFPERWRARRIR